MFSSSDVVLEVRGRILLPLQPLLLPLIRPLLLPSNVRDHYQPPEGDISQWTPSFIRHIVTYYVPSFIRHIFTYYGEYVHSDKHGRQRSFILGLLLKL